MNKLLALGLSLPLLACVVGSGTDTAEPGQGSGPGTGSGTGPGTGTGDHITTPTTWSGMMTVSNTTTVDPNVTLTIAAGTTVQFTASATLTVNGTLAVMGTKAMPVSIGPSTTGGHFGSIAVETGGSMTMTYGVQVGGGIRVDGGTLNVTDSHMSQAEGDFLVVGGGNVDVEYSAIGLEPGAGTDTTHCDMHFGSNGTTIKVTHSNISTSSYGLMLYGGNGVDLTYNNWFNNPIQIDTSAGVSGDISNGWFDKGAPTAGAGATLTYNTPAANRLPATMAGPR